MQEVKRNVCSILNKLTPQKFKELVSMMLQLKVNTVEKLEITCDLIFEKAVSEPNFCVAYANMCRVLTDSVSCFYCRLLCDSDFYSAKFEWLKIGLMLSVVS